MTANEFRDLMVKFLQGEELPYKEAWLIGYHAACMDADVEAWLYEKASGDADKGARKVADALTDEFREIARRYKVTQFKPKDLQRENDKLRDLCTELWKFGLSKNAGANSIEEWNATREALAARALKLGIEIAQ